jgi:thioredoxin reductase (NADPH)
MSRVECDLLIIGAGPVGLYAAYYAGFRGLSTAVVDSLPEVGGQVTAMYPEKPIYDVAGFPSIRGRELVAGLAAQADRFSPTYLLGERAQTLVREGAADVEGGVLTVTTHTGTEIRCRAILISGGLGTFTPRPLPVGETWLGRGLSYFVPSLEAHAGQDVVVVGGGNSACDWALSLEPLARSVTLVHRRASFRAHAHSVALLCASTVEVITNAEVTGIGGEEHVEHVEVTGPGGTSRRPAQAVIAALGFTANLGPIRQWGLEVVANRYLPVDTRTATAVPGVFAAGDISEYPGKVRLISVGFGEAATAVNNAAVLIRPGEQLFPGYSSDAAPVPKAAAPVPAIGEDEHVPDEQRAFVAENARFSADFADPLPGLGEPIGPAGGVDGVGRIGDVTLIDVDTDFVTGYKAAR